MTDLKVIVTGELLDDDGNLKQKFVKHNLITNAGYNFLADCFGATSRPSPMNYIAVGTGTTAPALTQTALVKQLSRKSATYNHTANTTSLTLSTTFYAGEATGALTEAGIFNASSGGIMFDRITFPVINKQDLDIVIITFTITFTEVDD